MSEKKIRSQFESNGWKVERNGWPDFLCLRHPEKLVIEVKDHPPLNPDQIERLAWFASIGVPAFLVYQDALYRVDNAGLMERADPIALGLDLHPDRDDPLDAARKYFDREDRIVRRKDKQQRSITSIAIESCLRRGKTQSEIAREFGLSRQRVSQIAARLNG